MDSSNVVETKILATEFLLFCNINFSALQKHNSVSKICNIFFVNYKDLIKLYKCAEKKKFQKMNIFMNLEISTKKINVFSSI